MERRRTRKRRKKKRKQQQQEEDKNKGTESILRGAVLIPGTAWQIRGFLPSRFQGAAHSMEHKATCIMDKACRKRFRIQSKISAALLAPNPSWRKTMAQ